MRRVMMTSASGRWARGKLSQVEQHAERMLRCYTSTTQSVSSLSPLYIFLGVSISALSLSLSPSRPEGHAPARSRSISFFRQGEGGGGKTPRDVELEMQKLHTAASIPREGNIT